MTSTGTEYGQPWQLYQDRAWLNENQFAEAIECPLVPEPRPEKPLNFGGTVR